MPPLPWMVCLLKKATKADVIISDGLLKVRFRELSGHADYAFAGIYSPGLVSHRRRMMAVLSATC